MMEMSVWKYSASRDPFDLIWGRRSPCCLLLSMDLVLEYHVQFLSALSCSCQSLILVQLHTQVLYSIYNSSTFFQPRNQDQSFTHQKCVSLSLSLIPVTNASPPSQSLQYNHLVAQLPTHPCSRLPPRHLGRCGQRYGQVQSSSCALDQSRRRL